MNAIRVVVALLVLAVPSTARAQVRRPVPTIEPEIVSSPVGPGSTAHVRLKVVLPARLHVQSDKPRDPALIATALTLTPPAGVAVARTTYPKAEDLAQPGRDEPLAVFSGTFVVDVQLSIARSVRSGTLEIPGELRYQSCTDQVCFPPSRAPVTWRITVKRPTAPAARDHRADARFTAIPCISNFESNSSVPDPMKARAGNSFLKYVR